MKRKFFEEIIDGKQLRVEYFEWSGDNPPKVGDRVQIREDCTFDEGNSGYFIAKGWGTPGGVSGGPAPMYSRSRCVANKRVVEIVPPDPDAESDEYMLVAITNP